MIEARSGSPARGAFRAALPAIFVVVAVLAPFLTKAYTIDDPQFLFQAKHLLVDPFHPSAFEVTFSSTSERMSRATVNGPAMPYLLLPCVAAGGAEWIAHGMQLALFVLALVATAALALRWGATPATAGASALLLAATPAALGMAGTAMPDVPAMAFGVAGVERAVAWSQDRRWHQGAVAALALAAAILFRSHAILIAAIAAWAAADGFRRRSDGALPTWFAAAPMVVVALVASVLALTRDPEGSSIPLADATRRFVNVHSIPGNLVALLTHWTVAVPLAVPLAVLRPRRMLLGPALPIVAVTVWLLLQGTPGGTRLLVAVAAGLGAAALVEVGRTALRRRDPTDRILAAWLFVPAAAFPYVHLPSKYLLAAAPAAAVVVARALGAAPRAMSRGTLAGTVALGAALGLLILRADAVFAGLGRQAAQELVTPAGASGATTWFDAHWGFQWYAERAGARPISLDGPIPRPGDFLIVGATTGLGFLDNFPRRRFIASVGETDAGGRTMCRAAGAGFYSNDFGFWPWAWSSEPADRYELWQLDPPE